ncbi:hypothetical protein OSH11_15800 [Kaistia dalseonensis]|uniref:Uncharacterized protein n=1 Tax=Kaistia dalseonensis TaxID=410840 RepID=A0ABU0H8Y3_9HYPH|nr:hypothetical protein [Kaistia dalseonensis]MCX5496176.1 hypothetical protein [Kaistia dalseonensis]MDQ0438787.1 hypothetical protein [Kaistia dalseonensis]
MIVNSERRRVWSPGAAQNSNDCERFEGGAPRRHRQGVVDVRDDTGFVGRIVSAETGRSLAFLVTDAGLRQVGPIYAGRIAARAALFEGRAS